MHRCRFTEFCAPPRPRVETLGLDLFFFPSVLAWHNLSRSCSATHVCRQRELSMFTPVQKAPYLMLLWLILSAEQACVTAVGVKKALFKQCREVLGDKRRKEERRAELLGHLFWRKQAKSGHGSSTVNLLRFIFLFRDFLKLSFSFSLSVCLFSFFLPPPHTVCSVYEVVKEKMWVTTQIRQ